MDDPKAKANYIKYCETLRKVIKEAKEQHYSRIIAKSGNKMKTTRNIIQKKTAKVQSVEQFPALLLNDGKVKDPKDVAKAFNNFFIIITEKLIVQPIEKGMLYQS